MEKVNYCQGHSHNKPTQAYVYVLFLSVFRSQNKVITHDQHGFEVSCRCYDDSPEDLDSILTSECSSPEKSKEYPLIFAPENKQGAARLDFIPKSNISELILERRFNDSEDYIHKSEIPVKHVAKVKDNLINRNVTFDKVKPSPQTQFPHLSIVPTSDQLRQQSSVPHLSSTIPQVLSTNQVGSVIACPIGSTDQVQTNNLIYGNSTPLLDQHNKDNPLYRMNPVHRLQQIPNTITNTIGGQFTSQVFPPLSICSNPSSINHSALIDNEFRENSNQPLLIKKDYTSQASTSIYETNSPKHPNSECFSTPSNIPLISKNMSVMTNVIISSLPNRIDLEQHPIDIQKGVFQSPNQNNQLQPQIPRLSQVDSLNISQLQSISNNQLLTQNEHQIQSQEASLSSISISQINRPRPCNNVVLAPLPDNRPSVSAGNLVDLIPCSFEQNKLTYQHYINFLHSQYYSQQLNALMLSQFQSPGQPIHAQIPPSTLPLQLSQISPITSRAIPSQNQIHDIPQVSSLPLSGIIQYNNNEMVPQFSTYSFSTEPDHTPSLNKSEKK